MAGSFLGSKIGMGAAGHAAGRGVGARLSRLMGTGDYTTNQGDVIANSLFGKGQQGGGPGTFEMSSGGVRIKHREYIQDIFLSTGIGPSFTNSTFIVNPGNSWVFPYLAQIAGNFEQYKFKGLVFEFVSSTSQFGQTALGTYVMAMEYNAAAPAFTSKPQMENSDYALSARLDKSGMYGVECAPGSQAQEYFYVRAPGQDVVPNLYDVGLMQMGVATSTVAPGGVGLVAGSAIGELWVTYDVELIRPRISVFRPGYAHLRSTSVATLSPLGTTATQTINAYGSLTGMSGLGQTNRLYFPHVTIGDVLQFSFTWEGTIGAAAAYPDTFPNGMVAFSLLDGNTNNNAFCAPMSAVTTNMMLQKYFQITSDQPAEVFLDIGLGGTFPGGVTACDVVVNNLGNGLKPAKL